MNEPLLTAVQPLSATLRAIHEESARKRAEDWLQGENAALAGLRGQLSSLSIGPVTQIGVGLGGYELDGPMKGLPYALAVVEERFLFSFVSNRNGERTFCILDGDGEWRGVRSVHEIARALGANYRPHKTLETYVIKGPGENIPPPETV